MAIAKKKQCALEKKRSCWSVEAKVDGDVETKIAQLGITIKFGSGPATNIRGLYPLLT